MVHNEQYTYHLIFCFKFVSRFIAALSLSLFFRSRTMLNNTHSVVHTNDSQSGRYRPLEDERDTTEGDSAFSKD